jgi:hypothetical protein
VAVCPERATGISLIGTKPVLRIVTGAMALTLVLKTDAALTWKVPVSEGAVYKPSAVIVPPEAPSSKSRWRFPGLCPFAGTCLR